jgi:hypothetical protein
VLVMIAVLLVLIVGMVAFCVDVTFIWRADAELQNAADAAALAGCQMLVDNHALVMRTSPPQAELARLRDEAISKATAKALEYGALHEAGFDAVTIRPEDIVVGYIRDPRAKPDTPDGELRTDWGSADVGFPNSVQVIARRDPSVPAGSLPLVFGPVFGITTKDRVVSATASLRPGVPGARILPIAMNATVADWLLSNPLPTDPAPPGAWGGNNWTVNDPREVSPPGNVIHLPDAKGIVEVRVFPDPDDSNPAGNFGILNLDFSRGSASGALVEEWITSGPSNEVIASWGENGLNGPVDIGGQTGLQATLERTIQGIIGQPRVMPIYETVTGPGSNATFRIVKFVGVVVDVNLTGSPKTKQMTLQLIGVADSSAQKVGNQWTWPGLYQISLSR